MSSGPTDITTAPAPSAFARAGTVLVLLGLTLATAAVFAVCVVLGFRLAAGERIVAGVGVLGVSLGGLTRDEATARLAPVIGASLNQPVELRLGDRVWVTSAGVLGFDLRPADLAEQAFRVGRTGSALQQLTDQWQARQYATSLTVSAAADPAALDALVARIGGEVDRAPEDAHLELAADGTLGFGAAVPGLRLDGAASRADIVPA